MSKLQVATLIGGAGTGKTSEIMQIMERALPALGGDPLRLGLASFTRRARSEAAGRAAEAWGVDRRLLERDGWFRTIHSTCQRQLGIKSAQLLMSRDGAWFEEHLGVRLTPEFDFDLGCPRIFGDPSAKISLTIWDFSRSTLSPVADQVKRIQKLDDLAPPIETVTKVIERYESAKRLTGRVDFTDMLLRFAGVMAHVRDGFSRVTPEGSPPEVAAWLFDEQQDASPLLDLVCKRLVAAPSVRWCYLVGDPFQSIYGFAGSSADCFLGWDSQKRRTMPKSYRCPKPILDLGEQCLRKMANGYFDRGIEPADHDGEVHYLDSIDDAVSTVDPCGSWLLLARTNYQARRLLGAMYSAGKPARWCKSPDGETAEMTAKRALWQLEHGQAIGPDEWSRVLQEVKSRSSTGERYLIHGAKAAWERHTKEQPDHWDSVFITDLPKIGATETLVGAIRTGDWVRLVERGADYYQQAKRHGPELCAAPRVTVGTIHSAKGGEADNVVLLTTTSGRIERGTADDPHTADEEHRVAYVGVTRARRNLYVVRESNRGRRVLEMDIP